MALLASALMPASMESGLGERRVEQDADRGCHTAGPRLRKHDCQMRVRYQRPACGLATGKRKTRLPAGTGL
jgi:hypothetical protein